MEYASPPSLAYSPMMRRLLPLVMLCITAPAFAAAPCVARKHGARVVHLCGDRVEAFHHRPKKNYARAIEAQRTPDPAVDSTAQWRAPASPDAGRHLMMRRTPGEPIPSTAH